MATVSPGACARSKSSKEGSLAVITGRFPVVPGCTDHQTFFVERHDDVMIRRRGGATKRQPRLPTTTKVITISSMPSRWLHRIDACDIARAV
eukprot:3259456-Prymnesium_polylepis.1